MVYARPFPWIFRRNISEEMLKVGRESPCFRAPIDDADASPPDQLLRCTRKEEPSMPDFVVGSNKSRSRPSQSSLSL